VITCVCRPDCIDWWKRTERSFRKIPQCGLVEGTTEELNTLYDGRIGRQSRQPYHFEYSKPGYTFTGIACLPVSAEIQSPEAEVTKGGLNCSSVTIRLTPVEEGEWSCRVLVCGKLCTTGPSADVSKQVHSLLCVTCCTAAVTILDTFVVDVSTAIYGTRNWEMCNISLMIQQFVVTHTIRQTELPALLDSCVTNTPVRMSYPHKVASLCIFTKS
jgi:hypothetical protein